MRPRHRGHKNNNRPKLPEDFLISLACTFTLLGGLLIAPGALANNQRSIGAFHSCALDDAGVHCWRRNDDSQIDVPALSQPLTVAVGLDHTCAVDAQGLSCWGDSAFGQATAPVLRNLVAVSAGYYHSCALYESCVRCWGSNSFGQTAVPALSF